MTSYDDLSVHELLDYYYYYELWYEQGRWTLRKSEIRYVVCV